jgi:hypothetical protein
MTNTPSAVPTRETSLSRLLVLGAGSTGPSPGRGARGRGRPAGGESLEVQRPAGHPDYWNGLRRRRPTMRRSSATG